MMQSDATMFWSNDSAKYDTIHRGDINLLVVGLKITQLVVGLKMSLCAAQVISYCK